MGKKLWVRQAAYLSLLMIRSFLAMPLSTRNLWDGLLLVPKHVFNGRGLSSSFDVLLTWKVAVDLRKVELVYLQC